MTTYDGLVLQQEVTDVLPKLSAKERASLTRKQSTTPKSSAAASVDRGFSPPVCGPLIVLLSAYNCSMANDRFEIDWASEGPDAVADPADADVNGVPDTLDGVVETLYGHGRRTLI